MIISIDAEKAFNKIQHLLMVKAINKVGIEGNFLNLVKGIYKNTQLTYLRRKDWVLFPKIKNKTMTCALVASIQHFTECSSHDV